MISSPENANARSIIMSCVILSLIAFVFCIFMCSALPFLHPWAMLMGCTFSILNVLFYRHVAALILGSESPTGLALMLLLKLPLLIVLLLILSQQSMTFIANALAGSLVFIPASLLVAMRRHSGL